MNIERLISSDEIIFAIAEKYNVDPKNVRLASSVVYKEGKISEIITEAEIIKKDT